MEDQFFLILIHVLCTAFAHLQELRHISVTGVLVKKKKKILIQTHYSLMKLYLHISVK